MKKIMFDTQNPFQDIKEQISKVERKSDNLTIFVVGGVILALLAIIALVLAKKQKYVYDAFDDDYYDDFFEDEFEDFDDEDFVD